MTTNKPLSNELIDKVIRVALEQNGKSSVMFLFRERLIREVIETAAPMLVEPFLIRINQLEAEIATLRGLKQDPKPVESNTRLEKLKDAIDEVMIAIEPDDPIT